MTLLPNGNDVTRRCEQHCYMGVITTLHKCKQCGWIWFHPMRANVCPSCKTTDWDALQEEKEVLDEWQPMRLGDDSRNGE
jgi:hypothetical protein